jgi:branched-chain amino acid transport system substrate-binding protein
LTLIAGRGLAVAASGPTQGVTEKTIKIGVFGPFSGNASVYSKAQHMAISVYRDQNEHGGVNGRTLDLVIADDACDPTTMQGLIRKFVEQDKVFMVHGGSCSNALITSKRVIQAAGVPLLTVNAASGTITSPPLRNLFQPKPTAEELGEAIVGFVASNPTAHRLAIVTQSDEWGQTFLKPVLAGLARTKLEIVVNEQMDPQTGDATPQVRKVLAAKPDMVIVFAYPQPMSVFLRSANPQGLNGPFVTGDGARPEEQLERIGSREPVQNLFSAYTFTKPVDDPGFLRYKELLAKHYPRDAFDAIAIEGAISAEMNIQALSRMGNDLTWESWIRSMESDQGFDTAVGGRMKFLPFDPSSPRSRRPGSAVNFSVLAPGGAGKSIVVLPDWAGWMKVKK